MARPVKYDWEQIRLDYESGLSKADIHKKHDVPYSTLTEYMRGREWAVSEQAKNITRGIIGVSEQVTELKNENPKLAKVAVDNAIDVLEKNLPEFKKAMVSIFSKVAVRCNEIAPNATASEALTIAKTTQTMTDTLGITQRHSNQQINIQNNNVIKRGLSDYYEE